MRPELRLSAQAAPGEGVRALVLDTNIVLDLLLFADPGAAPVRALLAQGRLAWLATQAMRDELQCVLRYPHLQPRLAAAGRQAQDVLAAFDAGARQVPEAPRAPHACKDADDQKFIDLAVAHGAVLVSKDKAVLCMRKRLLALGASAVAAIILEVPEQPSPAAPAAL